MRLEHMFQRSRSLVELSHLVGRSGFILVAVIGRTVDEAETSPYHILMRTTVPPDDDVYEAALCHARATGRRLGQVLSDMARRSMTPEPPPKRTRGHRFPAFDVPEGARIIASSRIQAALDEDGVV